MRISGIQKLTLLDYPGKVACTLFTPGCNLRCSFCHNASLALPEREKDDYSEEEILAFLQKRRGLLDGVAISGGEPLLQRDIGEFLKKLRDMDYMIKLDTNGTDPKALRRLADDGLVDRVAMDIKSSPEKYAAAVGVPGLDLGPIRESAAWLLEGSIDYEFRTTAVRGIHSRGDFAAIGEWIRGAREYYLQGFIDSGDLIDGAGLSAFTKEELQQLAEEARPFVPSVKIRGI